MRPPMGRPPPPRQQFPPRGMMRPRMPMGMQGNLQMRPPPPRMQSFAPRARLPPTMPRPMQGNVSPIRTMPRPMLPPRPSRPPPMLSSPVPQVEENVPTETLPEKGETKMQDAKQSAPGIPQMTPEAREKDLTHFKFTDEEIKDAFRSFDLDGNGFIGAAELKHVLINVGDKVSDGDIDEMIKMCDKDGDGQVSFSEFYIMITDGKQPKSALLTKTGSNASLQPGEAVQKSGSRSTKMSDLLSKRNARKRALKAFGTAVNLKTETVKKAFKRYLVIEKDGGANQTGMLTYPELCEVLNMESTPELEKLFELFQKHSKIDIREFVISLINVSVATKDERLKFGFLVFDEDGNNVITKEELVRILKANHMAGSEDEVKKKASTIMAQADKNGDGVINFEEFVLVSKKFPNILWPRI
eukprot:augustus_masked-scaffold_31-processed-gene-1.10-mRNA-1 protein AED:0.04 eAED:0.04 QI:0/-1/0/1/-1/1/1/0/413